MMPPGNARGNGTDSTTARRREPRFERKISKMDFYNNAMDLIWWAFKAAGVVVCVVAVVYMLISAHNHDPQGRTVAIFGIFAGVVLYLIGGSASGYMPPVPTF